MRGLLAPACTPERAVPLLIVALFLLVPLGGVAAAPLPVVQGDPPGAQDLPRSVAHDEAIPLQDAIHQLVQHVADTGGTEVLRPDTYPHYGSLGEEERQVLWQMWALSVAHDRQRDPGMVLASTQDTSRDQDAPPATVTTQPGPHGLRGLWTLDVHGHPQEVLSAGDGGYFLVTGEGILRFEENAPRPTWMVKTGSMSHAETTDIDGDGTEDLVLSTSPWFTREGDPNLLVVDGRTGDIIQEAFTDEERLASWRLTDLDGDGTMELVGLSVSGMMIGAALDGTTIWSRPLPFLYESAGYFLLYALAYYYAHSWMTYGDVDGDGALDLVTTQLGGAALLALLAYEQANANTLTAWSGVTGDELWTAAVPNTSEHGQVLPMLTGDLDGDGKADILSYAYGSTWATAPYVPAGASVSQSGFLFTSGEDGKLLADDRRLTTYVFPLPIPISTGARPYAGVVGLADLDRDGSTEFVTLEYEGGWDNLKSLAVVGRGPGLPTGPTEELWRQAIDVPKPLERWDLDARIRDADADGGADVFAHVVGITTDDGGNITFTHSATTILDAEASESFATAGFVYATDVDPGTGRTFAWTSDDRWVPLDQGTYLPGMTLVISGNVLETQDVTGDGTPDLLLPKSSGLHWIDGTSGRIAATVERDLNRYAQGTETDAGRLVVIERDGYERMLWAREATSGAAVWTIDLDAQEAQYDRFYLGAFGDYTGDGRLESLSTRSDYTGETRRTEVTVLRLPDLTPIWSMEIQDAYLRAMDVLPRPGIELLADARYSSAQETMTLYVPGEEAPRWSIRTEDRYLSRAADGFLAFRTYGETNSIEIVDAATGETNRTFDVPEEVSTHNVHLVQVNGDAVPDLVWERSTQVGRGERTHETLVHDLSDGSLITRFATERNGGVGPYAYEYDSMSMSVSYAVPFLMFGWGEGFRDTISDWDRDGSNDLLFLENERAVVRSGATGETLAMSSGRARDLFTVDLNGDGRLELGVLSAFGRLRMHGFGAGLMETVEPEGVAIKVDQPDQPVNEHAAFFKEESGLIPTVGLMPLVALIVALLGILARRRT